MKEVNLSKVTERDDWGLAPIPAYVGGTLSAVYATGYGVSMGEPEKGGRLQLISETSAEEFNAYLKALEDAGYVRYFYRELGENIYAQYKNGDVLVYIYYVGCEKETHVIHDLEGTSLEEFNYSYEMKDTDTVSFYQYALMFDPTGKGGYNPEKGKIYENCGLFDVMKLADNSLVLLDGGWFPQTPEKAVEECFKFLCEITGTKDGERLRIAALYFTHGHGDHIYMALRLLERYSDRIVVERLMHNLPGIYCDPNFNVLGGILAEKYPDMKFAKLHTGEEINLGGVQFDVIYTHEDMVDSEGVSEIREFNNTSVMLKMTANGRSFMLMGDWGGSFIERDTTEYKPMERSLIEAFKLSDGTNYLRSDAIQTGHHAINDWLDNFLAVVEPDVAFIPQQDISYDKLAHRCYNNNVDQLKALGLSDNNIFFNGRYTYGITVDRNGNQTLSYRDIAGADDIYLEQIGQYVHFHAPEKGSLIKGE